LGAEIYSEKEVSKITRAGRTMTTEK